MGKHIKKQLMVYVEPGLFDVIQKSAIAAGLSNSGFMRYVAVDYLHAQGVLTAEDSKRLLQWQKE